MLPPTTGAPTACRWRPSSKFNLGGSYGGRPIAAGPHQARADRLIEFFEALIKDASAKIFLILDNLRVHHSKPVKAWLADHGDRIEVFYLPSYAPELNPDERLNADLKHAIGAKVAVRTKAKLKSAAEAHMATIETSTERVKAYFRDPNVQYAA